MRNLTRAEAFKVLVVAGQGYGALPGFPNSLTDRFIDDDAMWDSAVSRLANFLVDQLIIDGCNPPDNTRVCPEDFLTRAQVAKVVAGTFGLTAPADYESPWTDTEGVAWDLMTFVVDSQTWGITAGVPSDWTVAQKNGFAGHIANSVGFVREPGSEEGYVVAVLTNWWSHWERGVPVVEEIAGWVSAELAH